MSEARMKGWLGQWRGRIASLSSGLISDDTREVGPSKVAGRGLKVSTDQVTTVMAALKWTYLQRADSVVKKYMPASSYPLLLYICHTEW